MISAMSSGMPIPPPRAEQRLNEEQQSLISETLSQYDSENMTENDALSIVESFSQAGIQPGLALEKSMSDLGFDAKNIGELAKVSNGGNRPPPPIQSTEEITSMVDYLAELLKEKLASSNSLGLSDEDKQSILTQVSEKYDID